MIGRVRFQPSGFRRWVNWCARAWLDVPRRRISQRCLGMTNVQFGVQYNGVSMSAVIGPLEFARRMESLGYRSFFVPELETLPTLDPFILLAAVAQHTERMRLGTGVAVPLALAAARFAPATLAPDTPCSSTPLRPAPAAASPSVGRATTCAGDGARPCRPAANTHERDPANRISADWNRDAAARGTSHGTLGHTTSTGPAAGSGAALAATHAGLWPPAEAVDGPLLPPKTVTVTATVFPYYSYHINHHHQPSSTNHQICPCQIRLWRVGGRSGPVP